MKTYKSFDKNLKCRDFQYEIGKTYELKDHPILCTDNGFHACENPLDVLRYYSAANSRFCETISEGLIDKSSNDTKVASSKITIDKEITLKTLIECGFKFTFEKIKWEEENKVQTFDYNSAAQTYGNYSTAQTHSYGSTAQTHGDNSAAQTYSVHSAAQTHGDGSVTQTYGNNSTAQTHGKYSVAQTHDKYSAAQTYGNDSIANTHSYNSAAQTHGVCSVAQTYGEHSASQTYGYGSIAQTYGNNSTAQTHGYGSTARTHGDKSIACSIGIEGKASGIKGNWLVLTEWKKDDKNELNIVSVKTIKVDGERIKENVLYSLVNGEFVEVL
jgi:hypothetical protein